MKNKSSEPDIILSPYMESVHRAGRTWCLLMVAVLIAVPLIDCILLGTAPDLKGLGMGLLATAPMYYAVCIVEVFTYVPMLGAAFLARNLKISILPLIVMTVLFITVPALNAGTVGIVVPVSVLFTVLEAWFMYKKGWV